MPSNQLTRAVLSERSRRQTTSQRASGQPSADQKAQVCHPFTLTAPYHSVKDVFCLHETRIVDGYQRIAVYGYQITIPHVELREGG